MSPGPLDKASNYNGFTLHMAEHMKHRVIWLYWMTILNEGLIIYIRSAY